MEIMIRPTPTITILNGCQVRLWEGVTEGGIRCQVFVAAVAADTGQDLAEFDRELNSILPPAEAVVPLSSVAPVSAARAGFTLKDWWPKGHRCPQP